MQQDEQETVKARDGMNKEDRYFFLALSFAQLGVVCLVVVFNAWFWHMQTGKNKEIYHLRKYSEQLSERNNKLDAHMKMNRLKRSYERHEIGVEEIE